MSAVMASESCSPRSTRAHSPNGSAAWTRNTFLRALRHARASARSPARPHTHTRTYAPSQNASVSGGTYWRSRVHDLNNADWRYALQSAGTTDKSGNYDDRLSSLETCSRYVCSEMLQAAQAFSLDRRRSLDPLFLNKIAKIVEGMDTNLSEMFEDSNVSFAFFSRSNSFLMLLKKRNLMQLYTCWK